MNILILCNGFKGTLTASQANQAIREGLLSVRPDADIQSYPMADGGQGSSAIASEIFKAEQVEVEVIGPDALPLTASYWLHKHEAFIEIAEASGLVKSDLAKPLSSRTSYGTGQLIAHALEHGAESISIFFGGSGTNDGGVGLAKALGIKFFDRAGKELPSPQDGKPYPGEQLCEIADFDTTQCIRKKTVTLLGVVDVANPLAGPQGASNVYGLQKGGSPEELEELDADLARIEQLAYSKTGLSSVPGLGAAGGAAFGLYAFCGALIVSGPPYFLDLIQVDQKLEWADIVITGEGKIDHQSVDGKLCAELLERCRKAGKPLYALCGTVEPEVLDQNIEGLTIFSTQQIERTPSYFETLKALAVDVAPQLVPAEE